MQSPFATTISKNLLKLPDMSSLQIGTYGVIYLPSDTTHLSSSTLGFGIITLYLSFLNITPMNIFGHVDPTPKNPLSFF